MDLLTWILVGLIAGVLASFLMGGIGYGLLGDILIGILGAFFGAWLFAQLGVTSPFGGLAGTIFVAFIGAVVLLFLLSLLRRLFWSRPVVRTSYPRDRLWWRRRDTWWRW